MAKKINLRSPKVKAGKRQTSTYGTQTPLSSTAVERGTTRWLDGSVIVLEGRLDATGTINGAGTNNFSGTNNLSGINNLSGTNHLTGPTDVAGDFEIIAGGQFKAGDSVILPNGSADFGGLHIDPDGTLTAGAFELNPDGSAKFGLFDIAANGDLTSQGTLSIKGETTLESDLRIIAGGMLTAGQTEIRPDGSAKFGETTIDDLGNMDIKGGSKVAGNFFVDDNATVTGELNAIGGLIFGIPNANPGDAVTVGYSPSLKKLVAI